MNKNIHISAGRMEQREHNGNKVEVYVEKVNMVVEPSNLAALFRRDAETLRTSYRAHERHPGTGQSWPILRVQSWRSRVTDTAWVSCENCPHPWV